MRREAILIASLRIQWHQLYHHRRTRGFLNRLAQIRIHLGRGCIHLSRDFLKMGRILCLSSNQACAGLTITLIEIRLTWGRSREPRGLGLIELLVILGFTNLRSKV